MMHIVLKLDWLSREVSKVRVFFPGRSLNCQRISTSKLSSFIDEHPSEIDIKTYFSKKSTQNISQNPLNRTKIYGESPYYPSKARNYDFSPLLDIET